MKRIVRLGQVMIIDISTSPQMGKEIKVSD